MISEFQKKIYNSFLYVQRTKNNQPFKRRENFDSFEEDHAESVVALAKLEKFFTSLNNINISLFFEAPFKIYPDKPFLNLSFYCSLAAVKCYTTYIMELKLKNPDNVDQAEFIKESLIFIKNFCIENKIELRNYLMHKSGLTYTWAQHYASNHVSIYCLLGFSSLGINLYDRMFEMPKDEQGMMLGDLVDKYQELYNNFNNSKIKSFVVGGLKKINLSIAQSLTSEKNSL